MFHTNMLGIGKFLYVIFIIITKIKFIEHEKAGQGKYVTPRVL